MSSAWGLAVLGAVVPLSCSLAVASLGTAPNTYVSSAPFERSSVLLGGSASGMKLDSMSKSLRFISRSMREFPSLLPSWLPSARSLGGRRKLSSSSGGSGGSSESEWSNKRTSSSSWVECAIWSPCSEVVKGRAGRFLRGSVVVGSGR
ncbi:hypothetical protein HDK64DRAFT_261621 [Phyllosticta capitalensis]